jgi:hypothetical protein
MERYKFYKDLSIQQIQFADSLTPPEFANWVNNGGCSPLLLDRPSFDLWMQSGGTKAALNQLIENAHVRSRTGQTYAQFDGFPLLTDVVTIPPYESNSVMDEMWASAIQKFRARYPQYVDNAANTALWKRFIIANRDNTGQGLKPCVENVEAFFRTCFSRLTLRRITKSVTEAGASQPSGTAASLKATAQPGQAWNPLLYADIQRKQQQNAQAKAAKESRERSPYARPAVEATLVEEILTPQQVMNLSADETAVLMSPMQFPGITDSAAEYSRSAAFKANEPAPQTASEALGQTPAMVEREVALFTKNYPQYSKYCGDPEHYAGLYEKIMAKLEDWKMAISVSSLLDGFRWAEAEGVIGTTAESRGVQRGQAVAVNITPDDNTHWTKTRVGDIVYHGKKVSRMTSAELDTAMQESPEFRKLLDAAI